MHKSDWRAGIKSSCGCGKSPRWTKKQYTILCQRASEHSKYAFMGFYGEWKGCDTKVILFCSEHGEWNTQNIDKYLHSPRSCPSCRKIEGAYGYYPERLEEEDTLYLLHFKNNSETFIKIGRTFLLDRRLKEFNNRTDYEIKVISVYKSNHKTIYKMENSLHKILKGSRVKPSQKFDGSIRECFSLDILEDDNVKQVFNTCI